jgi:hypothetical protein
MSGSYNHQRLLPRIIIYARDIVARVAATRLYFWARPVLAAAGAELLRQGQQAVGELFTRCV